jgi:hypothetical protein
MAMSKTVMRTTLAFALACGVAGAADARRPGVETILVRFRFPYAICAGVCPNFEMKVSPRGEVGTRDLFRRETYRFRATPAHLEAFRRALSALRPAGENRLDSKWEAKQPDGTSDPLALDPRPDDFEVRWTGGRSEARLTGCAFGHWPTRAAVQAALRALGADPFFGWDESLSPCGPGGKAEATEQTSRSEDATHPGEGDTEVGLTALVCRR